MTTQLPRLADLTPRTQREYRVFDTITDARCHRCEELSPLIFLGDIVSTTGRVFGTYHSSLCPGCVATIVAPEYDPEIAP